MEQIIFIGRGDMLVTPSLNSLVFKQIEKQFDLGNIVDDKDVLQEVTTSHSLSFYNYKELQEFKSLVSNSYELKIFTYKHLTFNFSNYNRNSVNCLLDQLNWIEKFIPHSCIL